MTSRPRFALQLHHVRMRDVAAMQRLAREMPMCASERRNCGAASSTAAAT